MKKIVMILVTVLILTSLIVNVNAVEISKSNNQINIIDIGEVQPFSLSNFINSIFGIKPNLFSVIGKANRYANQQCSTIEDHEFGPVNGGQTLTIPNNVIETYCGNDNDAIFDVFVNGYTGYMEFNWDGMNDYLENPAPGLHSSTTSTFTFTCASTRTDCRVQIYCCKDYIPTGQSDCDSGTYTENSCSSWINGGYKCTWEGEIESQIPWAFSSFGYCASSSTIDCYYYSGSGSTCTKYVSPDATCSGEYMSHQLYSTKSTCESNIQKNCWELPGDGKICGDGKTCSTGFITAKDSNRCCLGSCETDDGTNNDLCVGDEETFYTKGYFELKDLFQTNSQGSFEDYEDVVKNNLQTIWSNYKSNKNNACCSDLKTSYLEQKSGSKQITFLGLGTGNVKYTYNVYKCSSKTSGFCIETAQQWLSLITNSDDCQTNSLILIIGGIAIFVIVLKFAGT